MKDEKGSSGLEGEEFKKQQEGMQQWNQEEFLAFINSEKWEYFRKNVLLKIENKLNNVEKKAKENEQKVFFI